MTSNAGATSQQPRVVHPQALPSPGHQYKNNRDNFDAANGITLVAFESYESYSVAIVLQDGQGHYAIVHIRAYSPSAVPDCIKDGIKKQKKFEKIWEEQSRMRNTMGPVHDLLVPFFPSRAWNTTKITAKQAPMSELARPVGIVLRNREWNNWNHVLDQLSKPKPRRFEACIDSFKTGKTVVPCADLDDLLLNVIGFPENDGCAYLVYLTPGHPAYRSPMTMLQHASYPNFMFPNETVYRASSHKILALAHSDAFDAQRKKDQDFLDSKTPAQLEKLQKPNKRRSDLAGVVAQTKKLKRFERRRNSNASSDDAEDADESTLDPVVDALDPDLQASASRTNDDDIDGSEMDMGSDDLTPSTVLDNTTSLFDRNMLIDSMLNQAGTASSLSAHDIVTAAIMAVPEDQKHNAADQMQQELARLLAVSTPDEP